MTTEKHYIGIQPDMARFFIPVELDRPRVLAFDSTATFIVYRRYGDNFLRELYETVQGETKRLQLRSQDVFEFFLWAALQRDARAAGEELTLEQVSDQIVPTSIGDLASALFLALSATRRPQKKDAPKNV